MKRRKLNNYFWMFVFFALTFNTAHVHNAYGTEPPFLRDVKVKVNVNFNGQSGLHTYQYTVKNSNQITGNLIGFDIDISYPSDGAILKDDGLFIPEGTFVSTFAQTVPSNAKVTVLPV